ncbi:hypothetical protein [Streptomyces sp. SYP-A7185]|uniref:hypothetical protein n=1 Tax=Streptomyces sp. SYP-A7185 TaxID=3040076 RepID=UPI0038F71A3C
MLFVEVLSVAEAVGELADHVVEQGARGVSEAVASGRRAIVASGRILTYTTSTPLT